MENKLLQPLLQAGLLDIGDSDERLENIEKSITDVETKLKKEQSLLPAFTLVGLDPSINANEPVLADVEAIITVHWKALRAKFSETPVPIIRAVILNALYNIGTEDQKIARIIYLTATNFYPYAKLGREKEIVEKIILDLSKLAEENATEEWSLETEEPKVKLPSLKIEPLKIDVKKVDRASLKKSFFEGSSKTHTGFLSQNNQDQWAEVFSQKASEAVGNLIESSIGEISDSMDISGVSSSINKFFTEFKKSLDQSLKSSFSSIQAVERRSKLLWWKETLYSSSLKNSYRSVNEISQTIVMAGDLYKQLPAIVPVSVDYLLRDTLLLLNSEASKKVKFSELLDEISKDSNRAVLSDYFKDVEPWIERISITDFIGLLAHGKVEPSTLKQYTGIESNEQVSLADIAVMILHDLMAEYLISKSK